MTPGSPMRNRSSLVVQPMPIIVEDEASPPAAPERTTRRPPPTDHRARHASHGASQPSSSTHTASSRSQQDGAAAGGESIKNRKWFGGRRGWYRLGLLAFVLVAVIVGLAVGLTLGLRKRHNSSDASSNLNSTLFPAGSYSFTTALANVSTGCTTDPSVFRCPPFTTYSSSPQNSSMTFHWTITPVTRYSYAISSKPNDPAPSFADLPLTILDANQYAERLVFNLTTAKQVAALSRGRATCWFNQTVTSVTLWTRKRASYYFPPGGASSPPPAPHQTAGGFAPWPYMVEIGEVQRGGPGVPDCRDDAGESVVGAEKLGAGGECGCFYANFGLEPARNGTAARAGRFARSVG